MTGSAYPEKQSMPQVMLWSALTAGSHSDSSKPHTFIYQSLTEFNHPKRKALPRVSREGA